MAGRLVGSPGGLKRCGGRVLSRACRATPNLPRLDVYLLAVGHADKLPAAGGDLLSDLHADRIRHAARRPRTGLARIRPAVRELLGETPGCAPVGVVFPAVLIRGDGVSFFNRPVSFSS